MFRFLWRLVARPRRAVFQFRLQGRTEYRDPIAIRWSLQKADKDWAAKVDALAAAQKPLPANLEAQLSEGMRRERADRLELLTQQVADLTATAFGVPRLQSDGSGCTVEELILLLAAFLDFCGRLAEATRPLPNPPAATG